MAALQTGRLSELGGEIEFYAGLAADSAFDQLTKSIAHDPVFEKHAISVEHYIVSTGLRKMIEGSRIVQYVDGVWGCRVIDEGKAKPKYLAAPHARLIEASLAALRIMAYVTDKTDQNTRIV